MSLKVVGLLGNEQASLVLQNIPTQAIKRQDWRRHMRDGD